MKFRKINDEYIACHLNTEELEMRGADIHDILTASGKCMELLDDIEDEISYFYSNWLRPCHAIFPVEIAALNNGGVVLVFTQIDEEEIENMDIDDEEDDDEEDGFVFCDEEDSSCSYDFEGDDTSESNGYESRGENLYKIFAFKDLSLLSSMGKRLKNKFDGEAGLYKDEKKDIYVLLLKEHGRNIDKFSKCITYLSEYAEVTNMKMEYILYLKEKGGIINESLDIKAL